MQVQIPFGVQHKGSQTFQGTWTSTSGMAEAGEWTVYLITGLPFSDLQFEDNHLKTL